MKPNVLVSRQDLISIEFSNNGYCPVCAGWEVTEGQGCQQKVHTKSCWLSAAIEGYARERTPMLTVEQINQTLCDISMELVRDGRHELADQLNQVIDAMRALAPPLSAERAELVKRCRPYVAAATRSCAEGDEADMYIRRAEALLSEIDAADASPPIAQNKPSPERVREIALENCVIMDTRYNCRLATPIDVERAIWQALRLIHRL